MPFVYCGCEAERNCSKYARRAMQVGSFLSLFDCTVIAAAIVDTLFPPSSSFFFSSFLPPFFNPLPTPENSFASLPVVRLAALSYHPSSTASCLFIVHRSNLLLSIGTSSPAHSSLTANPSRVVASSFNQPQRQKGKASLLCSLSHTSFLSSHSYPSTHLNTYLCCSGLQRQIVADPSLTLTHLTSNFKCTSSLRSQNQHRPRQHSLSFCLSFHYGRVPSTF